MAFQQSVGINGIGFYTAETFVAAGKWDEMHTIFGRITACHFDFGKSYTLEFQQNHSVTKISSNSLWFQKCTKYISYVIVVINSFIT
jgi:hypothetical protein